MTEKRLFAPSGWRSWRAAGAQLFFSRPEGERVPAGAEQTSRRTSVREALDGDERSGDNGATFTAGDDGGEGEGDEKSDGSAELREGRACACGRPRGRSRHREREGTVYERLVKVQWSRCPTCERKRSDLRTRPLQSRNCCGEWWKSAGKKGARTRWAPGAQHGALACGWRPR